MLQVPVSFPPESPATHNRSPQDQHFRARSKRVRKWQAWQFGINISSRTPALFVIPYKLSHGIQVDLPQFLYRTNPIPYAFCGGNEELFAVTNGIR